METKALLPKGIKILAFLVLFNTGVASSQTSTDISNENALQAVLAAKEKAEALEVPVNIAVVDAGANLKAFIRMDDSFLGSIDVAIKKAKRPVILISTPET